MKKSGQNDENVFFSKNCCGIIFLTPSAIHCRSTTTSPKKIRKSDRYASRRVQNKFTMTFVANVIKCYSPTSRALVARFFLGLDGAARVHGHWWLRKGRGPLEARAADRLFGPEPRTEDGKRCCLHCRVRDQHRTPAGDALPPFVIESEAHVLLSCPREDARRLRVGLPAAPTLADLLRQAGSSRHVARAAANFLIGALPDRAREIEKRLRRPH